MVSEVPLHLSFNALNVFARYCGGRVDTCCVYLHPAILKFTFNADFMDFFLKILLWIAVEFLHEFAVAAVVKWHKNIHLFLINVLR